MNGNGSVVERLTRSTAEMSPHERSAQADTMRQKLVELAAAHNRLVAVVDAQGATVTRLAGDTAHDHVRLNEVRERALLVDRERWITNEVRLDALRRVPALASTFMARLRWLVLGR